MSDEQSLDQLGHWLAGQRDAIARQVTVRRSKGAFGELTEVAIDHLLVCELDEYDGWRISTKRTYLSTHRFGSEACHYLKTASSSRGRTIYCHDLVSAEVVAGVSYHIDDRPSIPVMLTTIGLRTDSAEGDFLRNRTLAGALAIKHHIHAVAEKVGRGGHVDLDLANPQHESHARVLGFRKAPRVKGLRPGGQHLRQPAPGS